MKINYSGNRKTEPRRIWPPASHLPLTIEALKAQSVSHAIDTIGYILDNYCWAINKHGLETYYGTISHLLKKDRVIGRGAGHGIKIKSMEGPVWRDLSAGSIHVGETKVIAAKRHVSEEKIGRGSSWEIAVLYDIQMHHG